MPIRNRMRSRSRPAGDRVGSAACDRADTGISCETERHAERPAQHAGRKAGGRTRCDRPDHGRRRLFRAGARHEVADAPPVLARCQSAIECDPDLGQQVTASGPLHATERTRAYLAKLNATPSDLLSMPVEKLVDALDATDPIMGGGVYFGPVLDMKWLTRHPFWPDANPQSNAIPISASR